MNRNERELRVIEKRSVAEALRFALQRERSERKRESLTANLKQVLVELNRLLSRKKG